MAMKKKTQGTLLAAMICVALSGGTAQAATPGGTHDEHLSALAASARQDVTPLRWDSVLPEKNSVATNAATKEKPKPLIITAADVREQKKQERASEIKARQEGRANANESASAPKASQQQKPAEPAKTDASAADAGKQHGEETRMVRVAEKKPAQPGEKQLYVPLTTTEEKQEPNHEPAKAPAAPMQSARLPQSAQMTESARTPAQPQMPLPVAPGTKYTLQPKQAAASVAAEPKESKPGEEARPAVQREKAPVAEKQADRDRPAVFRGVSERAYRHIQAGAFAMQHQLREAEIEPAAFQLIQLLNENDKLSRLDKIEYVIGICYAIHHSDLSPWQKQTLIQIVADYFNPTH
ncbi:MAG: hypothetical protein ACFN0X_00060 [Mitsuokella sp.]